MRKREGSKMMSPLVENRKRTKRGSTLPLYHDAPSFPVPTKPKSNRQLRNASQLPLSYLYKKYIYTVTET